MAVIPVRSNMRSGRTRRVMAEINVVPYIDVMLVLLVIFMVTAPLITPSIVNLPTVGHSAPQPQMLPVIVNLKSDGAITVRYQAANHAMREQSMSDHALDAFIASRQQAYPDQPVVIAADKSVRYEAVMNVMSALTQQGVKRIGLLVKASKAQP